MASFWKMLSDIFFPPPEERNDISPSYLRDYPKTFQTPATDEQSSDSSQIFDPALLHYARAFRLSDPHFEHLALRQKWIETRREVIDHLLKIINNSKWKEHLVLRGSLVLKAWLGDEAREPGDIDWVFRPKKIGINDSLAKELFSDLKQKVAEQPIAGSAVIQIDKIATDDIWTYERAAGKRIVFPWQAEDLPPGSVQMDVVFTEDLWSEPIQTQIPTCKDSSQLVWTVDKEVSLAWKLLWLETDMHPQGKDLYDATLLAEQTHLSLSLLELVLRSGEWRPRMPELTAEFPLEWEVDWDNFKLEYPWVECEAEDWQLRLSNALKPTFLQNI